MSPICKNVSASFKLNPEENRLGAILVYALGQIFLIFCLFIFLLAKYKWKFARIKARHSILFILVFLGAMVQPQIDVLEMIVGPQVYPCVLKLFLNLLIIPLIGGGIVGRLVSFYFRSRFEQLALELRKEDHESQVTSSDLSSTNEKRTDNNFFWLLFIGMKELFFFSRQGQAELNLGSLRFLQSGRVTQIIVGSFLLSSLLVGTIVAASSNMFRSNCMGCVDNTIVAIFLICQSTVIVILTTVAVFRSRQFPDNWGILGETILCIMTALIACIGYGLFVFLPVPASSWNWVYLVNIGLWLVVGVQSLLQVYLGWISTHNGSRSRATEASSKKKVANEESTTQTESTAINGFIKLPTILKDPALSKLFEEHLSHEFGLESLYFYRDAQKWTAEFNDVSEKTRFSRAKHIVNIYIRGTSVFSINIPSWVANDLMNAIDKEEAVHHNFFENALNEVRSLLERGAIMRFKQANSSLFQNNKHLSTYGG